MRRIVIILTIISLLTFYSTHLYAQSKSGAAGGDAVTAGLTTGTIVGGVVIGAALAAAIAASGGGGGTDEIAGPTAQQQAQAAEDNLTKNSSAATQSASDKVALALNSTEQANLNTAGAAVLDKTKTYGTAFNGATALAGLSLAQVQAALSGTAGNLKTYLDALNAANPTAYNAYRALLQSIVARNSQDALNALQALGTNLANDPNAGALAAVIGVLQNSASNYETMMTILLTAAHPGYNVYFVTTHGVTTSHLRPK